MTPTLQRHIATYTRTRTALGVMNPATAVSTRYTLGLLAESYGQRPVDRLARVDIERWLEGQTSLAPSTQRLYLSRARVFAGWLVEQGVIRRDPTAGVAQVAQPRHVERGMTGPAIAAVLAEAPDARARAMLWLMVGCGLRCVEVARLSVGDYDRRGQVLRVVGKGLHEREVPVPSTVAAALAAHLAGEGLAPAGPLFRSRQQPSRGLAAATVSRYVVRWMRSAGVKTSAHDGVSAHAFRHSCASDVLDRCDDIRVVQAMLGHQHVTTTERYVRRPQVERLREAMEGRSYLPEAA